MANSPQDARLRELALLVDLERHASISVTAKELCADPQQREMLVHMLHAGYLNGLDSVPGNPNESSEPMLNFGGKTPLQYRYEKQLWRDIQCVLASQEIVVRVSHAGRVRRSELEQILRTGRDREPFGILWAERHRDQAVVLAVLATEPATPVSVAYLDMNGLKGINDKYGHDAGDAAIRVYLQTIDMLKGEGAEGFRSGASDEVVVVMQATPADKARNIMRAVLRQLQKERVTVGKKKETVSLSASCGIATTDNPNTAAADLVRLADQEQMRAKGKAKASPGVSVLAVCNDALELVPP